MQMKISLVLGNGDQLVQLIMILGDNALKYSPDNGTISFTASKARRWQCAAFNVDQGPGIPEEDLPFLRNDFYKVDKSHCQQYYLEQGLDLRLPRKLSRVHGAKARCLYPGCRYTI